MTTIYESDRTKTMRTRIDILIIALGAAMIAGTSPANAIIGADSITPGMGIVQGSGRTGTECTAGFIVHTSQGDPALLTAGHCAKSADRVQMFYLPQNELIAIGSYRATEYDSQHDIALLGINSDIRVDPKVLGKYPVATVVDPGDFATHPDTVLCKMGDKSEFSCGPFQRTVGNRVYFRAPAVHGDSGSPVFAVNQNNGTLLAVGILDGSSPGDDSLVGAEMIAPYMAKWDLAIN
jgi:hypothetical protein